MYITLETAKKHLNIEPSYTEDDDYIGMLIDVSEELIAKDLCCDVADLAQLGGGTEIPKPLMRAILLFIGSSYEHRSAVTEIKTKGLTFGVSYLLDLYRDFSK